MTHTPSVSCLFYHPYIPYILIQRFKLKKKYDDNNHHKKIWGNELFATSPFNQILALAIILHCLKWIITEK